MTVRRQARPGEINGDLVDRFTFGHVAVGVLARLAGVPWWATAAGAIAWELVEDTLKDAVDYFPDATHDTVVNATGDVAGVMLGWTAINLIPPPARAAR